MFVTNDKMQRRLDLLIGFSLFCVFFLLPTIGLLIFSGNQFGSDAFEWSLLNPQLMKAACSFTLIGAMWAGFFSGLSECYFNQTVLVISPSRTGFVDRRTLSKRDQLTHRALMGHWGLQYPCKELGEWHYREF